MRVIRNPAAAVGGRHASSGAVRVFALSAGVGVVGGLVGAGYLRVLRLLESPLWPGHSTRLVHAGLLLLAGAVISLLLAVLGDPGETAVLIDGVHAEGGPRGLRLLSSLVPVSLLGIAVGGGTGPEPPLMQTTGTLGSWMGRRFALGPAELRVMTVAGMASGLTVLFGAPLGAAVFALEILHRKGLEYYEALLPCCAAALSSFVVYVMVSGRGTRPTWTFPAAPEGSGAGALVLGVGCGMAGAVVCVVFADMIRTARKLAAPVPGWLRPPLAGGALAVLATASPYALTFGEDQLGELSGKPTAGIHLLVLTAFLHLVSAAVCVAGRWRGGIIIPMFLVGYCLGRTGAVVAGLPHDSVVLAMSMMVACNVGMTKTPLGSALVVSQMTGIRLLPPLLAAALVSLCLTPRVGFVGGQRSRTES